MQWNNASFTQEDPADVLVNEGSPSKNISGDVVHSDEPHSNMQVANLTDNRMNLSLWIALSCTTQSR